MNAMKFASTIVAIVVFLYAILLLAQVWGGVVSWDIFIKITISVVVVIVAVLGLAMLYREYIEEKSMREDNYIS